MLGVTNGTYTGKSLRPFWRVYEQYRHLNTDIGGTEYEGGSSSGIRNVGNVYSLQRESTANNWLNWGSGAINEECTRQPMP